MLVNVKRGKKRSALFPPPLPWRFSICRGQTGCCQSSLVQLEVTDQGPLVTFTVAPSLRQEPSMWVRLPGDTLASLTGQKSWFLISCSLNTDFWSDSYFSNLRCSSAVSAAMKTTYQQVYIKQIGKSCWFSSFPACIVGIIIVIAVVMPITMDIRLWYPAISVPTCVTLHTLLLVYSSYTKTWSR